MHPRPQAGYELQIARARRGFEQEVRPLRQLHSCDLALPISFFFLPQYCLPSDAVAFAFLLPIRSVPFRSVPFRSVPFRSVPFRSVPFRSVPFRFISFRPVRSSSALTRSCRSRTTGRYIRVSLLPPGRCCASLKCSKYVSK